MRFSMASMVTIDLRQVGRGLDIPLRQIQIAVELLDEGNTVPFITRYRKDQTGGLDEEQIREIQGRIGKLRLLAERKQTILRSIESQGKLTEKLGKQILAATTTKRLEDLYLPYKPKKQTLATLARSRGLEQLANEILEAAPTCADLDARAAEFISVDRQVPTAADALLGAGHILAEMFSEQAELRQRLREVLQRTGVLVSSRLPVEAKPAAAATKSAEAASAVEAVAEAPAVPAEAAIVAAEVEPVTAEVAPTAAEVAPTAAEVAPVAAEVAPVAAEVAPVAAEVENLPAVEDAATTQPEAPQPVDVEAVAPRRRLIPQRRPIRLRRLRPLRRPRPRPSSSRRLMPPRNENWLGSRPGPPCKRSASCSNRRSKRRRSRPSAIISTIARNSAASRRTACWRSIGASERVLRVKLESDLQAMVNLLDEMLVPPGHPHADYLRGCARDALNRLILPSLERDVRRELTDRAELHAVGVFAKNLRNLLLQPPVQSHRLLAVDPGFKSGCKLAALDEFGNLLGHGAIYLVGKPDRRNEARQKVIEMIGQHQLTVVVIGNGTACRHAEDFFAELVEKDLKDRGLAYVIVNEAGASVYSTSRLGREEFPQYDATLRGAISIGRRLQDPLSELVKIDPASIGVGLYQHDVKARHLRTSLDDVVESCVNYVGVDVNTASPALLRYVSGLNQLTARRLYEHRRERGPIRSREQLREVPGLGEATFVQAAGFLKILDGDNPLDATWIHPESYAVANRVLERLHGAAADLRDKETAAVLAERITHVDLESLAKDLEVGFLTLKDILSQLARPGRDPREDLPAPVFKRGVIKLEDLSPGMELTGTVLNVVDFGCFVDIGMHDSGLVHVSRLADKFIRDPHDLVAVGDIVKVWVMEVDKERRRVSLTMVRPGTERTKPPRYGHRPEHEKPAEQGARPQGERPAGQRPPRPPRPQRPPHTGGPQGGQQGRPPRPHGRGRPERQEYRPPPRPRPAPKPVIPITDAMKTGKEPMRTFGDLLQFYQHKTVDPDDHKPSAAVPAAPPTKEETPVVQEPAAEAVPVKEDSSPVAAEPQTVVEDVPATDHPESV